MKNRFIAVLALVLLAFASVSMAVENLPQSEVDEIVKGVESGDAEAQFKLGKMYHNGQNVKQDEEQAVYWFKKSAEQGYVDAQNFLGVMYACGIKVKADDEQAEYWLKKAADQGYEPAKNMLEARYAKKTEESQTSTASTRASESSVKTESTGTKTSTASTQPKQQPQPSASESVMEINFAQTVRECLDNNLVYKRKYDGKKVRVTEKIFFIGTNPFNEKIYVRLSYRDHSFDGGINDTEDLYCYFEEAQADNVMKLKVDQRVTIEGTFKDCLPFSLENCRIVNAPQAQSQPPATQPNNTETIEIDEAVKEFMQRENIPYSIAAKGDVYLLRSYTSQFKAINGNGAYLYSEPSTSSKAILKLENGAKLIADAEYMGNDGSDWYYVHFGDSAKGWVQSQYITDRDPDDNSSDTGNAGFTLSDAEYTQMLKNSSEFAKADKALNNAWQNAKKSLNSNAFNILKEQQNKWISKGRDEWASILAEEEGEYGYPKNKAYAVATQARANYVSLWAKGYCAATVTGDKVNVRSKPNLKGKVLFQVSRYLYDYDKYDHGRERLIVDLNYATDNKGDKWHRVYYRYNYTPDSDAPLLYEKANGYINGRFVSLEYLSDRDYGLIVPSTAFGIF